MDDAVIHESPWGSPEPKVVVQKLSVDQCSPQKAHLSWLGWTVSNDLSPERPQKSETYQYGMEGCHRRRVRRRLISDEPRSSAHVLEDDEPLAQILDEQLFPEIGSSDELLKSPPNVDFLLGTVTPKKANDWDPEKVLEGHGVDIFGNERDRAEFTDFCEMLMAGPSGDSFYNNQSEMEYSLEQSPQSSSSHVWDSEEPDLPSSDQRNQYGTYENPKLVVCDALLLDNDQQGSGDNFSIRSYSPYISPALSYVTSPELRAFSSQDFSHWTMARRNSNRRWKKKRLGLRACDAVYFDGEKFVAIKVITDGTRKYRLVIPKNHKHSKGMPEDVAIFTVAVNESL